MGKRKLLKRERNQSQIHSWTVADSWAGAVMQKPLAIKKCDQWMDRWTYGLTDRAWYSCVSATKKVCLHFRTTEQKSQLELSIFWPFRVFRAKLPLPKCPWDPLNPCSCIPATALQGGSHRKVNSALLLAITQLELKTIHQENKAGYTAIQSRTVGQEQ